MEAAPMNKQMSVDPVAHDRYTLLKQANANYRRVATRLQRARKALAHAEADFADAARGLRLAVDGVLPSLVDPPAPITDEA
jgi:hypothetical protein